MSNIGGRAERIRDFDSLQWASIDLACRRLAHAFGYGPSWSAPTIEMAELEGDDDESPGEAIRVAWRGRVREGAMWAPKGQTRCKQHHSWARGQGVVRLPYAAPDPLAQAAVSYAGIPWPLLRLLYAYALEDLREFMKVEPILHSVLRRPHRTWAGRDALARIMFSRTGRRRLKGFRAIEHRAQDLAVDVKVYRAATNEAEAILRRWLVAAADQFNAAVDAKGSPMGASQGNGLRTETWWHPDRPFLSTASPRTEQYVNANRRTYLLAA